MGCSGSSRNPVHERFCDRYDLGEKLGTGAFGQVRLASSRDGWAHYAIKISVVGQAGQKPDQRRVKACRQEYELSLLMGCHPHCVQMMECLHDNHLFYLVMELCDTSLMDYIENAPDDCQEHVTQMFKDMLAGIAHCGAMGVIHRDVKPDNFLLGGELGRTIKLCDFGMAVSLPRCGYVRGVAGTAPYMAPEVVSKDTYNVNIDVWSFGVVAYLMLFGRFPYEPDHMCSAEMKRVIQLGEPAPVFEDDERGDFTRKLLDRSKVSRCSAEDALRLPLLQPILPRGKALESKPKSAAVYARAATKEFHAPVDPILQRNLDELVDRLQRKSGRGVSADPPAFICFSESDGNLERTDAQTQKAHLLKKQNSYSGFVDCRSISKEELKNSRPPSWAARSAFSISTDDEAEVNEDIRCRSDTFSEQQMWDPAAWAVDDEQEVIETCTSAATKRAHL